MQNVQLCRRSLPPGSSWGWAAAGRFFVSVSRSHEAQEQQCFPTLGPGLRVEWQNFARSVVGFCGVGFFFP